MSRGANNKSQSPPCPGHRLTRRHSQLRKLGMLRQRANPGETRPGPGWQLQGTRYQLAGEIKNKPSQSNVNMELHVTWSLPAGRQPRELVMSQALSKSWFSTLKRCRTEQRGQGASVSLLHLCSTFLTAPVAEQRRCCSSSTDIHFYLFFSQAIPLHDLLTLGDFPALAAYSEVINSQFKLPPP